MTAAPHTTDHDTLSQAAAILDHVGRTSTNGLVSIHCLFAVDLLVAAGADVALPHAAHLDDQDAIAGALTLLSTVEDDTITDQHVLQAVHYALIAHACTR